MILLHFTKISVSFAVNSAVAKKMLDDNAKAFSQITANFSSMKVIV